MSKYKNPYVKLERLSFSVIDRFLSASHSSLEEQPERETRRTSRSAKQKVKTYRFESASEDESSDYEESDLEGDSNHSDESDLEFNPNPKVHSINRPFKCKVCHNGFKLKSNRDCHMKMHTGKCNYRCEKCSAPFSGHYDFNTHMKKHGKPHQCTICSSGFYTAVVLALHMQSDHKPSSLFTSHAPAKAPLRFTTSKELQPLKKKRKMQETLKVEELTEYERLIQNNKSEKMAFLQSLKIDEVKESFAQAVRPKRILKPKPSIVPRHKIARSSKVDIDLSENGFADRVLSEAMERLKVMEQKKIVHYPSVLNLEDVLDSDQSYERFIDDYKDIDQGNTEPIDNYESGFQDMELLESHIAHFGLVSLAAMDIHPMRENTIIAAGGSNGKLYLCNINSDSEPYAFKVHNTSISHLKFNPENPHLITCTSTDGTLRVGDLVANVYKKVNNASNCNYFDFLNPVTCLVCHRDGYVSVVDMRETQNINRNWQIAHQCSDHMLRSVSVHPVNKNEFITPTNKGCVRLWDLRKLEKRPVMQVSHRLHLKALYSAIFSPLTGKLVLTSSQSGRICMFDTSLWGTDPRCTHSISRPGISRATWQPRTDSNFAVVNRKFPSAEIEIYNTKEKIFSYTHEGLKYTHCCTFHPSLPIIAAAQGSKVRVFADKKEL